MQWLLNWAIAYSTPYLTDFGPGYANLQSKIFFVWFAACFLCIAFVYFFIYETKGLTLEEVDELYDEVKIASKSTKWKPSGTFRDREGNLVRRDGEKVDRNVPKEDSHDGGVFPQHEHNEDRRGSNTPPV